MIDMDFFSVECGTCQAAGTTACSDCVVTHLLANDDGPIDLLTTGAQPVVNYHERAVQLFTRAGLLDLQDPVVAIAEFEASASQADGLYAGAACDNPNRSRRSPKSKLDSHPSG